MITTNKEIVDRIKEARLFRGMTQQNLADALGKTSAAISDLERGKVQVSAIDLLKLAAVLNKPIEYFYGEEIGDKEIEDFVAVIRRQPQNIKKESMETTRLLLQMQSLNDVFDRNPDNQPTFEEVKDTFIAFITFSKKINDMTTQINTIRDQIMPMLKEYGININPG
jgi:transcriptional regulator with XRE-family HTH domain